MTEKQFKNVHSVIEPLCLKLPVLLSQRLELCLDCEPKDHVRDGYGVDDRDHHDEGIFLFANTQALHRSKDVESADPAGQQPPVQQLLTGPSEPAILAPLSLIVIEAFVTRAGWEKHGSMQQCGSNKSYGDVPLRSGRLSRLR